MVRKSKAESLLKEINPFSITRVVGGTEEPIMGIRVPKQVK